MSLDQVPDPAAVPTRRGFLAGAAALGSWLALRPAAGAGVSGAVAAAAAPVAPAAPAAAAQSAPQPAPGVAPHAARAAGEPPFRISLAEWSLHRALFAGEIGPLDFARIAKQDYGIDAIEHVSVFLKEQVRHLPQLQELRSRADDLGVRSLLIMIDGEGELGDADDERRRLAVENHFKWLAAANLLGCHSIRVNAGGEGSPQALAARAADSLHRLATEADGYGLNVIVENHGGLSSDGAWLAGVIRAADHPRVGTLPDFGNFRISPTEEYDRYRGVAELMPFARGVSAKSYGFDAAGNETTIDFPRMLKIVLDAGYHGHVGIEYEGDAHSERQGIALTQALLARLQVELA